MRKFLLTVALASAATNSLYAHGPQIQTTATAGKIVTREVYIDGPYSNTLSAPKSVYVMPFLDNLGVTYARPNNVDFVLPGVPEFYSGPGLAIGHGFDAINNPAPFPVGSKFFFTFTDGFKKWDGSAFSDPGAAQLQAFTGGFAAPTGTANTSDAGPFGSLAVPAGAATVEFSDGAEEHATVRYRYLGDGANPSSAPNGIYLLSLQLSNPSSGLAPSDPLYYVLNKNGDPAALSAAIASLGISPSLVQTLVPEPASAGLAAICLLGLAGTARRRKAKRS